MINRFNVWRQAGTAVIGAMVAALVFTACGTDSSSSAGAAGHIHGLGIDPSDGALFVATHGGLFRSEQGSETAAQVGDSEQDTMGFSITGPEEFLGSGHPGPSEGGPPNLGLIRSTDAGQSWEEISLAGEADFHVLRSQGERVYGFNGVNARLMVSEDGGESWQAREPPAGSIDLAIDPADPERVLVSTDRGLLLSEDGADSWELVSADTGLLAWPESGTVYVVDAAGEVSVGDAAGEFAPTGAIGAQPVAFAGAGENDLYAALPDGSVLESRDGGSSWQTRTEVG